MYVINEKRRAEDTALMLEYGSRVVKDGQKQILPLRNAGDLQGILFHNEKDDPVIRSYLGSVKPMDEDWKKRVQQEFWWGRKGPEAGISPILYELRDKLLTFGGESVCLSFGEPDAEEILACGQFWHGYRAVRKKGRACRCHDNSLHLYFQYGYQLCTGYALSDDGMWRQHSWCIYKTPHTTKIVETTVPRVAYFGYVLGETSRHQFARGL